jgi:Fe-S-cluster containining protein
MDESYGEAASQTGFSCDNCDGEACCTVDLPIHTFTEKLLLKQGLASLEAPLREEIRRRCGEIVRAKAEDPRGAAYRDSVCALSFRGRCALYRDRPMICRLAGIPHFIARPDGKTVERGGCVRYEKEFRPSRPDLRVDRSDLYRDMAVIEVEVVRARGERTPPETISEVLFRGD